ncbi:MAG: hypothetical protein HFJ54_02500 [Clostridia bacterium]|nr:hypothetical protein [Clostridia bacterium]
MTIVTFWNNNTGKIGQTHSALAIAAHMAVEHNYKILLMSTKYNDQVTMKAFGFDQITKTVNLLTNNKNTMDLESGIEGMSKLALSNRLTADMVPNYTRMIFKKRLEVLAGPQDREDEKIDYKKIYDSCKTIANIARQYYDIVFVDLNNGLDEEATKAILKISNIVIVNVEQKPSEFTEMVKLRSDLDFLNQKNTMFLINRYDRSSKYSTKNVTRDLMEKKEILSVPYNHLFAEAMQEGTAAEFFLNPKIRKLDDTEDRTAFFISELKRAEEAIIYKMQELQMRI